MKILYISSAILIPFAVALALWRWQGTSIERKSICIACIAILLAYIPGAHKVYLLLFPPHLEVFSLTPVCVFNKREDLQLKDFPVPIELTMYLIVEVQNGQSPVYLATLDIIGNLPVLPNMWLGFIDSNGRNLIDLSNEYKKKLPYFRISWAAWHDESGPTVKLEPNECRILKYKLWNPIVSGQREEGYWDPLEDYIGYADNSESPKRTNGYPSVSDFCNIVPGTGGIPSSIRDEFRSQSIRFILRAGTNSFEISKERILPLKIVSKKQWETNHISHILHEGDALNE